jgi:hypothetical protein
MASLVASQALYLSEYIAANKTIVVDVIVSVQECDATKV